jgi:hypothetical protein
MRSIILAAIIALYSPHGCQGFAFSHFKAVTSSWKCKSSCSSIITTIAQSSALKMSEKVKEPETGKKRRSLFEILRLRRPEVEKKNGFEIVDASLKEETEAVRAASYAIFPPPSKPAAAEASANVAPPPPKPVAESSATVAAAAVMVYKEEEKEEETVIALDEEEETVIALDEEEEEVSVIEEKSAVSSPTGDDEMDEDLSVSLSPSGAIITEAEVRSMHKAWGDGLVTIATTYDEQGFDAAKQVAQTVLDAAYGYVDDIPVLFKPTLASGPQTFRLSNAGALSYFVGGDSDYPDDTGFAIRGWRSVESYPVGILLLGDTAISLGNVYCADKDGKTTIVDKTWAYKKDDVGNVRIILHHSSLPYKA